MIVKENSSAEIVVGYFISTPPEKSNQPVPVSDDRPCTVIIIINAYMNYYGTDLRQA